jgi:hypothetical protein
MARISPIALHAFQQANGIPIGKLDQQTAATLMQLSNAPVLAQYTIQPDDVKGPFAPQIPQDFEKMAALERLGYQSPRELLAEKFHMSEGLLAALNPHADFWAGWHGNHRRQSEPDAGKSEGGGAQR